MAHVRIIDQTLRDGHQSLWGMQMQAGMCLPVNPIINRTGYDCVDLVGSSMFEIMVRNCREDPWAGLDMIVGSLPNQRIRAGMRCHGIITMSITPDALMDLWVSQLCEHGIRSFWIHDPLHVNIDKMHRMAKVASRYDAEVVLPLMFCLSPVHTDEFYGQRVLAMADSPDVDRILIYDMAGLMTPERIKTLAPVVIANSRGKEVEIIAHNIAGLAPQVYLAAIEAGVDIIHTCSEPLANGASIPSVEMMARNLRLAGHTHDLDESLFKPVSDHFYDVAKTAGFPVGITNEYDLGLYHHQIPGGMTGTLKNQLAGQGMADRLDEVLAEVSEVRKDLGYPALATPFSQLVGTLAVLHVITGKRYESIPDEVLQYAYGHYGPPPVPIDPDVMDKIDSHPRAKDIRNTPPPNPILEEIRSEYGNVSNDELILRALVSGPYIDAMREAGPVWPDYPLLVNGDIKDIWQMMRNTSSRHLEIVTNEMSLMVDR